VEEAIISVHVSGIEVNIFHLPDDTGLCSMLLLWLTFPDDRQICAGGAV
jgi:hypothetical protein